MDDMDDFLENEDSDEDNYNKVLSDLNLNDKKFDENLSVKVRSDKSGIMSFACNSLNQMNDIKCKMMMRGFMPLTRKKIKIDGEIKYILIFNMNFKFPNIYSN